MDLISIDSIQFNEHSTSNRNNKKYQDHQQLETPDYFEMISEEDQHAYRDLQLLLSSPDNRYARNKKVETIKDSMKQVEKFCIKDAENDWKRFLVCGLFHLKDNDKLKETIAINIRQLKILLNKSKSTINSALSKMGFVTFPTKGEDQNLILRAVPYFEGKYFELRQWTIRKRKVYDTCTDIKKECNEMEIFSPNSDNNSSNEIKFDNLDIFDNDYLLPDFKFDEMRNNDIFDINFDDQYGVFVVNQSINSDNDSMFANVESIIKENKMKKEINSLTDNYGGISSESYGFENIWTWIISSPFLQFYFIYNFLSFHINNNMVNFFYRLYNQKI